MYLLISPYVSVCLPLQTPLQFDTFDGILLLQAEAGCMNAFISQTAERSMVLRETQQRPPYKQPETRICHGSLKCTILEI